MTTPAKLSDLSDWAAKRGQNLERMIEEARRDDCKLFQYAANLLDDMAKFLHGVGDEAGSIFASSLARRLENTKSDAISPKASRGRTPF
jgi:hypothetical protein